MRSEKHGQCMWMDLFEEFGSLIVSYHPRETEMKIILSRKKKLKGARRDYFNWLSALRVVSPIAPKIEYK